MSQGKLWCFTIHAQEGVLIDSFSSYMRSLVWGEYGGGQCEISPTTGSLHFQGFVLFRTNHRFNKVVSECVVDETICKNPRFELAKGSLESNEAYCSKESTRVPGSQPVIWGRRPDRVGQGRRSDLDRAADIIRNTPGTVNDRLRVLAGELPGQVVRYHRGFEALAHLLVDQSSNLPAPDREDFFGWQESLYTDLMETPDDRTVHYVYDPQGNNGKSSFVRYFLKNHSRDSIHLEGRVADMAHAYDGQRYVFIDIPRSAPDSTGTGVRWTPDHLYHFAEKLKNGFLFSGKFNSTVKTFRPPHVVFLSNAAPLTHLWTADRLHLIQISDPPQFNAATIPL